MKLTSNTETAQHFTKLLAACGLLGAASLAASPVFAQDDPNDWRFAATVYGWFPDISGQTNLPVGDSSVDIDIGTILDHLKMTGQGSFEFQKGNWGGYTNLVYLNVGETKSQTRNFEYNGAPLPASVTTDLGFDLKSLFWSLAATYQLSDSSVLLFGTRLASFDQDVDWEFNGNFGSVTPPPRTGNNSTSTDQWDGIIGVKGRMELGEPGKWAIPYHVDVGTGDSDFTYQGVLGLSYGLNWGFY